MSRRSRCGSVAGPVRQSTRPKPPPPPTPDEREAQFRAAQSAIAASQIGLVIEMLRKGGISSSAVIQTLIGGVLICTPAEDRKAVQDLLLAAALRLGGVEP